MGERNKRRESCGDRSFIIITLGYYHVFVVKVFVSKSGTRRLDTCLVGGLLCFEHLGLALGALFGLLLGNTGHGGVHHVILDSYRATGRSGCDVLLVANVGVGSVVTQHLDHIKLVGPSRLVERCLSCVVLEVGVGALAQDDRRSLCMPKLPAVVESAIAKPILSISNRRGLVVLEELLDHLHVPPASAIDQASSRSPKILLSISR